MKMVDTPDTTLLNRMFIHLIINTVINHSITIINSSKNNLSIHNILLLLSLKIQQGKVISLLLSIHTYNNNIKEILKVDNNIISHKILMEDALIERNLEGIFLVLELIVFR